ncbi:MAG: ATP phosphoribosyltransferase [Oscillospiraceae bacterium]|nr:ATP phosphoribosyltransferase [Oscillospiraceae bacterium]
MADIKIAITKGRLLDNSIAMFERAGYDCSQLKNPGRRLIHPIPDTPFSGVLAKAPDVITYVEHGVCAMGIVGRDTIMEHSHDFYEVLDLGFGKCRFAVAAPKDKDFYAGYETKRIASKYPKVAHDYFLSKGMDVSVIKIEGSVELAPLLGLSDAIVDIVETGSTLAANGLEVIETICQLSARLIVNTAAMKLHRTEILEFVDRCRGALE